MDFAKLRTLKEMVMTATRLAEPWDYFFDHLSNDFEFMELGKRVKKAPLLTGILETVGGQVFGAEKARVRGLRLTSLKRHSFVHGACHLDRRLTTVLYFTDVEMGILAINDPGGQTYFVRFTNFGVVPASADGEEPILAPVPPTRGVVN